MSKIVNKIDLAKEETACLESILRQAASEARVSIRAKILLLKHNGYTNLYYPLFSPNHYFLQPIEPGYSFIFPIL